MRITLLLPDIRVSGGVICTFELANRLQDRGHDVSIVYPLVPMQMGRKWYNFRKVASRVVGTIRNLIWNGQPNWFDLKAKLIMVPTLAERWIPNGDVIVATLWATAYYVNGYKREKGNKFYFPRGYETWCGPVELVDRSYTLPLQIIVPSTWLKNLIETKFERPVLGPLPDCVNFDLFYKDRDVFDCRSPKRVGILYRRRFKLKGMRDGLGAFLMAKKQHPNILLVLFGEKPTCGDMKILENVRDVELHIHPRRECLRKIFNSLDIFIFPSHSEGFGDPPMEAMACGVAVVATNVGGVPDYTVPGETALISPPKDPKSLGQNVIRLLQNEEERKRIAENGYNHIKQFPWDRTAADLEEIFLNTCKSR